MLFCALLHVGYVCYVLLKIHTYIHTFASPTPVGNVAKESDILSRETVVRGLQWYLPCVQKKNEPPKHFLLASENMT